MTYVVRCFFIVALLVVPFIAVSQNVPATAVDSARAETLNEVVIQATRAAANSPIPHQNFSAAKLASFHQTQDVPMLLSAVPSLVESSDAGIGIGYTGMRIRGSDPTRVNVTINGVPFNDAESQLVYWVDLPDIAASVAEIQVQRGVGSSTNGAGAFGATINLDLSKVPSQAGGLVSSTLGSFGSRKFSSATNTGILDGKWAFSARASSIHSDGYIERAKTDLKSLHLSGAYLGNKQTIQLHYLLGSELTYQAWNGVPAQFIEIENLRTYNSAGTERLGSPHPNEVDNYVQQHLMAHYKLQFRPNWMLQLNGHYTRGLGFYEQYKANQAYSDYGFSPWEVGGTLIESSNLIRQRWLSNHFYGGTFALRRSNDDTFFNSSLLGGAWSRYEGKHFGKIVWSQYPTGFEQGYLYYDNKAVKNDWNIYLKLDKNWENGLSALLDLQLRQVAYSFEGFNNDLQPAPQSVSHVFFNPKIGLTYPLSSAWDVYGFSGIAHREPNRDDYTQSSPQSRPLAERLLDVESGFRFQKKGFQASINAFYMAYQNQLVLDGRINDVGAYIRTNVPKSYRAGVELEANAIINTRLSLLGNFCLSQNKVQEFVEFIDNWDTGGQYSILHKNSTLAFSPALTSRMEAQWRIANFGRKIARQEGPSRRFQLYCTLSAKYVGKQYLDNTSNEQSQLTGYGFSDLRINVDCLKFLGTKTSFILSVNNISDAKYSTNGWIYRYLSATYDARLDNPYTVLETGNTYHQAGYFPQAGRHWMATVRVEF